MIILGGAIAGLFVLWQPTPLEGVLPAQSTVALFSHATHEDLRTFQSVFGSLKTVPVFEGKFDLGVITVPGKGEFWVLASPIKENPLPSVNVRIGRQELLASDTAVEQMLLDAGESLRSSHAFSTLARGIDRTQPWIFVQNAPATVATLPPRLRPLMQASGTVLLALQEKKAILRILATPLDLPRIQSPRIAALTPAADFSLALGNPLTTLDAHWKALPESERLIQQGILTRFAGQLLGGEWSWTYDIAPLLAGESALSVRTTGTGALSFFLSSTMRDSVDLRERLAAVHDRFRMQLAGSVVLERKLDREVTWSILQSDPAQVEDRMESINGWTVRQTREGNGTRMLGSATRAREVVFTNNREWLNQLTRNRVDVALPSLSGSPIAGGHLSPALVDRFAADVLREPGWMWLLNGRRSEKGMLWSVEADADTFTVSVRKE